MRNSNYRGNIGATVLAIGVTIGLLGGCGDEADISEDLTSVEQSQQEGNRAPELVFLRPSGGASLPLGTDLYVRVNASDGDGNVRNVKLYLNNRFVRQENFVPYEWGAANQDDPMLQNMSRGSYTLKAVVTDNSGARTSVSRSITVGIDEPDNRRPRISFAEPADGASIPVGSDLYVRVLASDDDGHVSKVKLRIDNSFVRQENYFPYEWGAENQDDPLLQNMRPGHYYLTAVATDDDGAHRVANLRVVVGTQCNGDSTCAAGELCSGGVCVAAPLCQVDSDCPVESACVEGICR